jgi:hypothetical protein
VTEHLLGFELTQLDWQLLCEMGLLFCYRQISGWECPVDRRK